MAVELDQTLRRFYAEARAKDGELYGRSSLLTIRIAIERFLGPPQTREIVVDNYLVFDPKKLSMTKKPVCEASYGYLDGPFKNRRLPSIVRRTKRKKNKQQKIDKQQEQDQEQEQQQQQESNLFSDKQRKLLHLKHINSKIVRLQRQIDSDKRKQPDCK